MSTALNSLKPDVDIKEDVTDTLGGSFVLDTDVYPMTIDEAYMGESKGGAINLNLVLKQGKSVLRQTLYITSGKAKGQKSYYEDKKTGAKRPLPGMAQVNSLCELLLGKQLWELETETKVIKLYDYETKKDVNTEVEMVMPLLGKEVEVAVFKQIVDKRVKNDAGDYVASGETREENEVDKFYEAGTHLTVAEKRAGATTGTFQDKWLAKWRGQTRDRSTAGASAGAPKQGLPSTPATAPLFPQA